MKFQKLSVHRFVILLGISSLLAVLYSCTTETPQPEQQFVGTWQKTNGEETMMFSHDGTVKITKGDNNVEGMYSLVGPQQVQFELGGRFGGTGPIVANYSISEDKLTMTMPDGATVIYRKTN